MSPTEGWSSGSAAHVAFHWRDRHTNSICPVAQWGTTDILVTTCLQLGPDLRDFGKSSPVPLSGVVFHSPLWLWKVVLSSLWRCLPQSSDTGKSSPVHTLWCCLPTTSFAFPFFLLSSQCLAKWSYILWTLKTQTMGNFPPLSEDESSAQEDLVDSPRHSILSRTSEFHYFYCRHFENSHSSGMLADFHSAKKSDYLLVFVCLCGKQRHK